MMATGWVCLIVTSVLKSCGSEIAKSANKSRGYWTGFGYVFRTEKAESSYFSRASYRSALMWSLGLLCDLVV
jgi:hypothetical protein